MLFGQSPICHLTGDQRGVIEMDLIETDPLLAETIVHPYISLGGWIQLALKHGINEGVQNLTRCVVYIYNIML